MLCVRMTLSEARSELGVTSRATDAEVRRAFKKLALAHHPDRNAGRPEATARFRRVLLAYEILSGQRAPSLDGAADAARPAAAEARAYRAERRAPWEMPFVEALPLEYADGEPLHFPTPEEIRKLSIDDPADPRRMMSRLLVIFIAVVGLWWLLALLDRRPPPVLDPARRKLREKLLRPY